MSALREQNTAATATPPDYPPGVVLNDDEWRKLRQLLSDGKHDLAGDYLYEKYHPQLLKLGYSAEDASIFAKREAIRLTDPCEMRLGSLNDIM